MHQAEELSAGAIALWAKEEAGLTALLATAVPDGLSTTAVPLGLRAASVHSSERAKVSC